MSVMFEQREGEAGFEERYRLHRRFDRMGRLVGDDAMKILFRSHVVVIGLGGVGSWAAESLARSGIGKLTLVDFDEICVTNFNRQLPALQGRVGEKKAEVMGERLRKINPQCEVVVCVEFYRPEVADRLLAGADFVVDAIDSVTYKCHLLAECRTRAIPVVTSTGSGGRLDPLLIRMADLAETQVDPLARSVRRILREKHAFPAEGAGLFGIPAIYSIEPAAEPRELHYDEGQGFKCVCPQGDKNEFFQCDNRNLIMGNSSFVTGAFGLAAASHVVRSLIRKT